MPRNVATLFILRRRRLHRIWKFLWYIPAISCFYFIRRLIHREPPGCSAIASPAAYKIDGTLRASSSFRLHFILSHDAYDFISSIYLLITTYCYRILWRSHFNYTFLLIFADIRAGYFIDFESLSLVSWVRPRAWLLPLMALFILYSRPPTAADDFSPRALPSPSPTRRLTVSVLALALLSFSTACALIEEGEYEYAYCHLLASRRFITTASHCVRHYPLSAHLLENIIIKHRP